MKLCTFAIKTALGKYNRLGVVFPDGILDLNFAAAYYLLQMGEIQPYQIANTIVPCDMLQFLQTEATGMKFARLTVDFFQKEFSAREFPTGANEETLFYKTSEVKLKAPLQNPNSFRDFYAFENHVKKGFEKRG